MAAVDVERRRCDEIVIDPGGMAKVDNVVVVVFIVSCIVTKERLALRFCLQELAQVGIVGGWVVAVFVVIGLLKITIELMRTACIFGCVGGVEIVVRIVVLFELPCFRSFFPALKLFVFDEYAEIHALPQTTQAAAVFDDDDGLAIGTVAKVNLVLLLQCASLKRSKMLSHLRLSRCVDWWCRYSTVSVPSSL